MAPECLALRAAWFKLDCVAAALSSRQMFS